MNELMEQVNKTPIEIALDIDEDGMTTARKLYTFLELAQGQFSRWVKQTLLIMNMPRKRGLLAIRH